MTNAVDQFTFEERANIRDRRSAVIVVDVKQTVLRWSLAADRLFGVSAGDAVGEQLPRVAQRLLSPWDRIQSALAGYAPTRFICDETGLVVSVFPGGDHHVLLVAPRTGSLAS